jgi:hypothetical protein
LAGWPAENEINALKFVSRDMVRPRRKKFVDVVLKERRLGKVRSVRHAGVPIELNRNGDLETG